MNETLPHRSRKIRAVLAGFLVLGIGIITTVAVWNDDIFGTGDFEAGGFALEGSIDGGTVWDDYGAAGEAAVLFNQDNLQLVTSYYKEFWVRIKAGEKAVNNIEVSLPSVTKGSGGNENYLDYEIFNITAAGSCAEGAFQAGLAYGSFVHTDDQVISTAFTSAPMAFSKGDQYFGISPVASDGSECSFDGNNCTKLCVNQDGMYDIAFSAQFAEETNENVRIAIWLWKAAAATPFAPPTTKDPNNVPWTGSEGLLTKQVKRSIYAWNFLQRASAGECFALLWAINTNTTITMASETTLGPGVIRSQVPSLILTIEQMG